MISDNIRNYRKANNMSQDELAEKLGVSRQSISLWENGQTQPTIDNIIALSKIFNVSSDEILGNAGDVKASPGKVSQGKSERKKVLIMIFVSLAVVIGLCIIVCFILFNSKNPENRNTYNSISNVTTSEVGVSNDKKSTDSTTSKFASKNSGVTASKGTSGKTSSATITSKTSSVQAQTKQAEKFDLFSYCKNFAIKKGHINGDYTIYQQPATNYGGYKNEYFSISYWGDSNMVEFCLHCPLDDTLSVNFYLRMRGGYNKKYEYLSSKYFRDTGESLRSASGYIDPSVFSENYPLNCNKYDGSLDGQTEFMEESRVGMCDLIYCLKKFVEVEKMDCGFSAFDFVNF